MATVVKWLQATVYLTNKAQVDALNALYPAGLYVSPAAAAVTYAAPIQTATQTFAAPCVRSEFIVGLGNQNYPTDQQTFVRKSGGWFGIPILFGNTTTFHWYVIFAYVTGATAEVNGVVKEVVAIAQRKWIIGFEEPVAGESGQSTFQTGVTRDASRHIDGYGYSPRNIGDSETVLTGDLGAAQNKKTWERIYIRCRVRPTTGDQPVWTIGSPAGTSAQIRMTADGKLGIYKGQTNVYTQLGVSSQSLTLNTWYRLDILSEYAAVGGNLSLYVNRALFLPKVTFAAGQGISLNQNHTQSIIGAASGAGELFEIDYDDWIGSEWPSLDSFGGFAGIDWLNGSKVQHCRTTGFSAGNTFTGAGVQDYRTLNTRNPAFPVTQYLSTTVSAAVLRADISTVDLKTQLGSLGCIAFKVCATLNQLTSTAGSGPTLGWKFDGLTDLAAITLVANTVKQVQRLYRPSGLTAPIANLTPLELHHVKIGNVSEARCYNVAVSAELVGTFGIEDVPLADPAETTTPATFAPSKGLHMAPYPETQWARRSTPVISPVVVHSGTYVGNGQVVELQFRAPVTWILLKIAGDVAGQGGLFWITTTNGAHDLNQAQFLDSVRGLSDPSFVPAGTEDSQEQRFIVRITGTQHNVLATTYQYVAFCDPGARYSLNGQFFHSTDVTTFDNLLQNPDFLPEWVFFQRERYAGDATYGWIAIGPGHTGGNGSQLSAAQAANMGSFSLGKVTSLATGLNNDALWAAYAAFRSDDQSSDPNKHKVLRIGTYTGDGAASRTIGFAPSGLRPLYAIVNPVNAVSIHRAPGNTGTNSSQVSAGTNNAATGITAGAIDSMTVGSVLNANGIVYNYFVILGSPTAGNGGWSIDGEFIYVEPDSPADGADDDPTLIADVPAAPGDPDPDPGPDDGDDCNDGAVCIAATTKIVNLALLEIGSVQVLDDYCTQDTKEAVIARRIYEQCVRHTLITYPWPFATKYAPLVLTATQPSNQDWTYSYRMPVDCIFPRRVVVTRGTAVDPSPPPMGLSSDDSGGIIFSNEPAAVLEYTARPGCVGFNGDDLFREALKWRLAAAFAPPLTRMPGEAERCLKMFEVIVQKAESIVKQGVPGLRGAASTLDTTAAAIAANIQVVNMALVKIGSRTIANLTTEQTREAVAANLVFEDTLRSVLRDFPWAFATRYLDPATLVDGAEGDPATPDWTFSHRLPVDLVFLRRLVTVDNDWSAGAPRGSVGRSFDATPYPYRLASDATGGLFYSNVEEPVVEYTARLQNILVYADPLFREALSWKLAATLAPSLASVELHRPEQHGRGPETPQDPTRRIAQRYNDQTRRVTIAQWAEAMYQRALVHAQVADRNESQPEPNADADWIRGRD